MKNTIVVLIERRVKHPKYRKFVKRSTKVHAHVSNGDCQVGDIVLIKESRPISKMKHWLLVSVKERVEKV